MISRTLSADETAEGEVGSGDVPAVFAIDVPADSPISVSVTPADDLDPMLAIVDPDGESSSVDLSAAGEAEVAVLMVEGRHILRVTGYEGSVGSFEIVTAPAIVTPPMETRDLAAGEPVTASVPAAFNIEVSGDQLVVVRSSSDLDTVLEIVHPNGESSFVDSSGGGGVEVAELTGEGPHLLTVSGYDDSDGSFDVVTAPVQTQDLVEGEPVTASAPAVFDVDVDTGELFGFTAEPARPDRRSHDAGQRPRRIRRRRVLCRFARTRGARHGHHRRQHSRCVSDHRHFRRH